ncbi:8278_t:CDS:2 [Acaulospora morrowiae]|uniref:8278_t:CDS:1 n=1 Tax=Acaulospora morrowiae TaxID=94023 RepID=A0A9N9D8V9_9GLOM|nr:8278_t:CDS:2 [Acaulospora morrowiae]
MIETQNETTTDENTNSTTTYSINQNFLQRYITKHLHISPHIVAEISRTFIAGVCFLVIGFICTFAIQWSDQRWKDSADLMALVDLGFKAIPETNYIFLADLSMLTLLIGSLALNLFLAESNIARLIIVRRIFWMLAFLLLFRTITLSVTTLPSPKACTPLESGNFGKMLKTGLDLILGSVKACTDNIFSGHSVFITTSLLIATRIHYTVDVLLAIFITYAAHSIYFFIVDLCIEKHFLNIKRAEDRLGDKDLYQRIAYMPNMFNTSLVGAVRWMDGLDIRFTIEGQEILEATRERARMRRIQNVTSSSTSSDSTQVEVVVLNNNENEGEPSMSERSRDY